MWHFAEGDEWEWKADTSSDEMDGHFFAYAIAFDLLADEFAVVGTSELKFALPAGWQTRTVKRSAVGAYA